MVAVYSVITLPAALDTTNGLPVLIMRLMILAAIAVCGQLYSQVEERRRFATADAFETLLAQTRRADEPHV